MSNLPSSDPFAALGLERSATPREIKAKYYQLARRYHPNSNHGVDITQRALDEHFHRINNAYKLLINEEKRRRLIEFAELEELDNAVDVQRNDLEYEVHGNSESDSWSSEFDDTEVAEYHRGRRDQRLADSNSRPTSTNGRSNASSPSSEGRGRRQGRKRTHPAAAKIQKEHEDGREDSAARKATTDRRKRLVRIKRREVEVYEAYRDAKFAELEAQIHAEKLKNIYEKTKARREMIEAIPMESSTRVKLVRNITRAVKLLRPTQQPVITNKRLSISTGSILGDGEFVNVSSPVSARPGAFSHRRGWSSDISGDQTDSDEETPHPVFRQPFRSLTPNGRPPVSRERSPAPPPPLNTDPNYRHNHHHDPHDESIAQRLDSKFRLFVKRPTGFEDYDTDGILSPQTPAPIPIPPNLCRELVPANRGIAVHVLESFAAHEPIVIYKNPEDSDSDSSRSPSRSRGLLDVKSIGELRFPVHIPFDCVHKLNKKDEARMLGTPLDTGGDPQDLLDQLKIWDPNVANWFMVKPDIKAQFAFRLVYNSSAFMRDKDAGFIALSYRRKRVVEKQGSAFTLPLSKEMMQAVWEERLSDSEGLWIDQCCIKQDDDFERTVSMSAMDLVYRGARLIVVVLDDVELKVHESAVLENHIEEYDRMTHVAPNKRFRRHMPPRLEQREDMFNVIQKILSASWFKRAWCRHEMRLAKDHVFLIPCQTVGSFRKTILRLSSACIAHLLALATEVPFNTDIEPLKPALYSFFKDRTEGSGHNERSHHGNFTTVAAEVFGMEAGGDPRLPEDQRQADARWDKMSIILNAMECGLALQTSLRSLRLSLTKDDCYYALLMLALAARDPGALCAAGKPLTLDAHRDKPISSWLFEPTVVDAGLNNYKTLTLLPLNSHLSTGISRHTHWIQLDLKFVGLDKNGKHQVAADVPEIVKLAEVFMSRCEENKWGRQRRRYMINDAKANKNFGSMREVYVQTLTGLFCCGPDWMGSICQRYGVGRWKQDLQVAKWLLTSLRNMYGKWPELPPSDDWTSKAAAFIMDFVNFIVIRGMPQRQMKQPEPWRPIWITTRNYGKVLTFKPDRTAPTVPAIPSVLLNADYLHLARLWILEPRKATDKWTLLGKSVMFSDELAKRVINVEDDMVRRQQRVYGRILDPS